MVSGLDNVDFEIYKSKNWDLLNSSSTSEFMVFSVSPLAGLECFRSGRAVHVLMFAFEAIELYLNSSGDVKVK